MNKTCFGCANFIFSEGQPELGEYTPGSDWYMECRKNKFGNNGSFGDQVGQTEFARRINLAVTCSAYEQASHVNKDGTIKKPTG